MGWFLAQKLKQWICIFSAFLNDNNILLHNNIYLQPGNASTCWPPNHVSFFCVYPPMTTTLSIYGYFYYLKSENRSSDFVVCHWNLFHTYVSGLSSVHASAYPTLWNTPMCGMWTSQPKDSCTLAGTLLLFALERDIHLNVCECVCMCVHVWGQVDH